MQQTEPQKKKRFEVTIESGGRAYDDVDELPVRAEPVLSPMRSAAKARARRRNIILASAILVIVLGAISYAWVTNPSFNIPSDAVARVNGEFIYDHDVEHQVNFQTFLNVLYKTPATDPPSAASALEDLITDMMQVQDAKRAGQTPSEALITQDVQGMEASANLTETGMINLLAKYNLTMADLRTFSGSALLVKQYVEDKVTAGATSDSDYNNLYNDWLSNLATTGKIERFKAAGAGPAPRLDAEAPDFTLKDMAGNTIKLSSLRGQPVMINFWATWCPPCRDEIPIITSMYNDTHANSNYEILGVATQSDDATVRAFSQELKMDFPLLPDVESRVVSLYHVLPIPTTFFIDKDGIIRLIQTGAVTRPMMEQWLLGK
jgi:peroxiredoxin